MITLPLLLSVVLGCNNDASEIEKTLTLACTWSHLDGYSDGLLPDEPQQQLRAVTRPKDVAFGEAQMAELKADVEDDDNPFSALGQMLAGSMSRVASAVATADARHALCQVEEVTVADGTATATVHRTSPELDEDDGLAMFGELNAIADEAARVEKVSSWMAKATKTKNESHDMKLYEDEEGTWRIDFQMPEHALAEIDSELAKLEAQQKDLEEAQQKLQAFEVVKARFYETTRGYRRRAVIDLTVRNGTDTAISRAYFQGTLKSPDRSVPWVDESFIYQIPGGIEPGEELRWRLEPNMFSEWGKADAPNDAVLHVVPTRLDGSDGEELLSAQGGEDISKRRTELENQRNELKSTYSLGDEAG